MDEEKKLIMCSNKALVAFLLKNGVKPADMRIGRNDTILFYYDPDESDLLYEQWKSESR